MSSNKKCPYCNECLESLGHIDGSLYFYCVLCGFIFKLMAGNTLEKVGSLKEKVEWNQRLEIG